MSRKPKEASSAMRSNSLNRGLGAAKAAKKDEFYTQLVKNVEAGYSMKSGSFKPASAGPRWGNSVHGSR
jgi:hypothetical protein